MSFQNLLKLFLVLLILWAAITLMWWSFGTKVDRDEVCEKTCYMTMNYSTKILGVNDSYHTYTADYYIPISCLSEDNPIVENYTFCYHTWSEKRRITLIEVLQDQAKGAQDTMNSFASWVSGYKVV